MKKADKVLPIYKIERKKGTVYQAKFRSKGKDLSKVFERKVDAIEWLKNRRIKNTVDYDDPTLVYEGKTLKWLCDYWLENYARVYKAFSSVKRDEGYIKNQILPELGAFRISEIKAKQIELWLAKLRTKLAIKTCNDAISLLKKIFSDAVRWQMLTNNPAAAVKRFKVPENDFACWSFEEKATFLNYMFDNEPSYYPIFLTALLTGMRAGELAGLKWDCVELSLGQITVKRSFCQKAQRIKENTKSSRIRRLPMSKSLRDCLIAEKAQSSTDEVFMGFYFPHAAKLLRRFCNAAGVKEIRFHDLRHVFASHLAMSGISLFELQKLMGHQTIQMTERYSHLMPNALNGLTDVLDVPMSSRENVVDIRRNSKL